MIVKPRLYKTLDGRIALVSATMDKGVVVSLNGPYQIVGDPGVSPEQLWANLAQLYHEAMHAGSVIEEEVSHEQE